MERKLQKLGVFALVLLSLGLASCKSGPDVIFIREDLEVNGAPRAILRLAESVEADVFYFDGETWILAEDTMLPAGWDVVTPAVVNSAIEEQIPEQPADRNSP